VSNRLWHIILKQQFGGVDMPKNKIQFQKGLSLPSFLSQYGTEEQCRKALFSLRWPDGFNCPTCCHDKYSLISTRLLYQCCNCHRQTSLISGTVFDSTKLPLTTWFLAIYFITQSKDGISSLNLSRTIGVSVNAAQRMKHKLQQVMKNRDDERPLSGIVQMDDAYLGGKRSGCKRGRGAAGKAPFIAAVSTDLYGNPLYMRMSRIAGFKLKEISRWATGHLDHRSIVVTDGLPCFAAVEHAGCAHESIILYDDEQGPERKEFRWVNTVIGNVKNSIRGTYHAVSSKHLPRYFAEFCYRFNRRFDLKTITQRLLRAAVNNSPIPQRVLTRAES
jgi:transposase-like protein